MGLCKSPFGPPKCSIVGISATFRGHFSNQLHPPSTTARSERVEPTETAEPEPTDDESDVELRSSGSSPQSTEEMLEKGKMSKCL